MDTTSAVAALTAAGLFAAGSSATTRRLSPIANGVASGPSTVGGYKVTKSLGVELSRETMGGCTAMLQKSFHADPERLGYYLPLPDDLLHRGQERDAKIDERIAMARQRNEMFHLAYTAEGSDTLACRGCLGM